MCNLFTHCGSGILKISLRENATQYAKNDKPKEESRLYITDISASQPRHDGFNASIGKYGYSVAYSVPVECKTGNNAGNLNRI